MDSLLLENREIKLLNNICRPMIINNVLDLLHYIKLEEIQDTSIIKQLATKETIDNLVDIFCYYNSYCESSSIYDYLCELEYIEQNAFYTKVGLYIYETIKNIIVPVFDIFEHDFIYDITKQLLIES